VTKTKSSEVMMPVICVSKIIDPSCQCQAIVFRTRVVQVIGTWLEILHTRLRTESYVARLCAIVSWCSARCPTFPLSVLTVNKF
jgi:hypothetical protein